MAGIHCLHHVEGFGTTHLTHDDTVRAHTQRVLHEVTDRHFFLARVAKIHWLGLKTHDVWLREA